MGAANWEGRGKFSSTGLTVVLLSRDVFSRGKNHLVIVEGSVDKGDGNGAYHFI